MEKLVIIILTLAIIVFAIPNQDAKQQPTLDLKMSQTAIPEQTEEVPKNSTEKADVREAEEPAEINSEPILVEIKPAAEEKPAVQETPIKTEELKESEPEETVECVDEGDQSLAEYKPQIDLQSNPFEDDTQTEIVDSQVEDLIGEGEDRPGEGKQF